MAENAPIRIISAGLPGGDEYCFTNANRFALDIAAALSGYLPGEYNTFNYGNTEPAVEDRSKPWFRLNGDGSPDKWYVYHGGAWVSPHPVPPSSQSRIIWVGIEADLWAYDGGDGTDPGSTAPSDAAGAVWEKDSSFDFRVPLGAGTSPSVTQPSGATTGSTTVSVGDTGGAEDTEIVLDSTQLPPHKHAVGIDGDGVAADSEYGRFRVGAGTELDWQESTASAQVGYTRETGGDADEAQPISKTNMPPYIGVLFAKRTARKFLTP